MKKTKSQKILEKIAVENGVSVAKVKEEINKAIDIAISNPDPEVQLHWKNMKFKGKRPTPEEFVIEMAKQVYENKNNSKIIYFNGQQ